MAGNPFKNTDGALLALGAAALLGVAGAVKNRGSAARCQDCPHHRTATQTVMLQSGERVPMCTRCATDYHEWLRQQESQRMAPYNADLAAGDVTLNSFGSGGLSRGSRGVRVVQEDLSGHHPSCAVHVDPTLRCSCQRQQAWDQSQRRRLTAPEHPRCSGCGTHSHGPEEVCPDRPDEPEYMDESWGEHNPYYDW